MIEESLPSLVLKMQADQPGEFFPLLQQGVAVAVRVGWTLEQLLSTHWGLSSEYVARRITTIFLDGRPLDDVGKGVVREGSVVALSGAMPGLVGATMRRGGYYAAMRDGITYRETAAEESDHLGRIRVKLFNLLLPELGPHFLSRGIVMEASALAGFLAGKPDTFWQGCIAALLNGRAVDPSALRDGRKLPDGDIALSVAFEEQP